MCINRSALGALQARVVLQMSGSEAVQSTDGREMA